MSRSSSCRRLPRLHIRPTTAIFALLLLLLDHSLLAWLPLLAALTHELGHILVMRRCHVPIVEIEITLFGAELRCLPRSLPRRQSAAISLAGPLANLLSAGLAALLFSRSLVAEFFILSSLTLALLNLLPIRTLDGGSIAALFLPPKGAALLSAGALFGLWLPSTYLLLLCGGNLSLLLFCGYLFWELYLT